MELRILNLNSWHGLYARTWVRVERLESDEVRERRTVATVEGIKALDPHVVTLQECFPQPAFADRLAAELGYPHVSQVSNAGMRIFGTGYPLGVETGEGSTILAKPELKMRSLGRKALSGYGLTHHRLSFQFVDKRMALACALEVDGKELVVVTFHVRYDWASFALFEKAWGVLRERSVVEGEAPPELVRSVQNNMTRRDNEIATLATWVEKLTQGGVPFVLSGDLNLDDDAPQTHALMARMRLASSLQVTKDETSTWNPVKNTNIAPSASFTHPDGTQKDLSGLVGAYHDQLQQRPDHVFVSPALHGGMLDAKVVLDETIGGAFPSDHFGILSRIKI